MDIPQQFTGKESDNASEKILDSIGAAMDLFRIAADRLLNVNEWKEITGLQSAVFDLCGPDGKNVKRSARKGDYIRIDIPGPGSVTGDGYDWVTIIGIQNSQTDEEAELIMTVKPSDNPTVTNNETAHFFDSSASSTFKVHRIANKVRASIHGRNEKPNENISKGLDKLRNTVVAAGAVSLFSDIQWQNLAQGLIAQQE